MNSTCTWVSRFLVLGKLLLGNRLVYIKELQISNVKLVSQQILMLPVFLFILRKTPLTKGNQANIPEPAQICDIRKKSSNAIPLPETAFEHPDKSYLFFITDSICHFKIW